jgi:hypothetical protein
MAVQEREQLPLRGPIMPGVSFAVTQPGTISIGVDGELANELTRTLRLGLAQGPRRVPARRASSKPTQRFRNTWPSS